jgi:hypothetical protein
MKMNMKQSIIVFIFILSASHLIYAQDITIKGNLSDTKGNPIPFANIYLETNTEVGTLTDLEGDYELVIKEYQLKGQDTFILIFSALGFKVKKVDLNKKSDIELAIFLEEEAQILDEVVLSSESNASKEYTVLELDKRDIYSNPTASADPLKAILLYPYSTNTDETANPSLRGSNPDKSRVVLNGVPIFNPVRNNQINGLGNFSLFNTEMVDKQLIYPSNPPLIHGNSSAGIVEIETSKQVSNTSQVSLSLASVGILLSRDLDNDNFIQLYSNKQFSNLFLDINKEKINFLNDFSSFDVGFNLRVTNKDDSHFNIFSYFINEASEAETSILNTVAENKASRTRFFTVANYSKTFENFKITFNNGYDYSKSPALFSNIDITSKDESFYSSINFSFNLDDIFLKTGANYNHLKRNFRGTYYDFFYAFTPLSPTSDIDNETKTNILEGYVYGKIKFDDFIFSAAIRKNIPVNNSINDTQFKDDYISFQSFLRWNLNKNNNFILSAGKYHSYSNPSIINQRISLNSSFQASLDYTYQKKNTQIKASIYSKREKGVINNSFDLVNNTVDDRTIYGLEFQFDKNITKDLKLNASYTFINSELDFDGETFRASNDLNYFVKGSLSYYKKGWNLAISSTTRPGTYYTDVVSSTFNSGAMAYEPTFSDTFNSEQLGNYFRVDFSANKSIDIGDNKLITFFSVNNVFDIDNERNIVYNVNYSDEFSEFFPGRLIYFGAVYLFQ